MALFRHHYPVGEITLTDLERVQANISEVINPILDKQHLAESQLLEAIALTGGSTVLVQHKLGRTIRGWSVVDTTAAATYYRDTTSTADLSKFLPIRASATTTVSLVVF